ncbi:MAG: HlyC/CorC family transporter [Chloroflexi bacterium]|nr:HlyC/CorC family transporter [Chloroflexota bacterium]
MVGEIGVSTLVLLGGLLLLSGFFSGSEAALLSVQRVRIQHLVSIKTAGAARVAQMVERPDKLLPPILLGNNLVNTAVAAVTTATAITVIGSQGEGVLVATGIATVLLLIFGETIPKTVAARHAERTAILVALPIRWLSWLLLPASFVLEKISGVFLALSGGSAVRTAVTVEEIKTMVTVGWEAGTVERGEAEMIRRVLEFGGRRVQEVMTPRPEIVWVERGATIREYLELYDEKYHTRFPVFDGSEDNVSGLIAVKDVMRLLAGGASLDSVATTAIRPATFVPETKLVQDLFDEMRANGEQLVMIADEFGGVAGLVTLKRLIEGIVGPVSDEDQPRPDEVVALGENTFEVDAGLSIAEVNERLGIDIPKGEYETVAGFLLERIGSIPEVGTAVEHDGVGFSVTEMRGVRIARVRVTLPSPPVE